MRILVLLVVAGLFVGCAHHKTWTATGGSRSDGIVRMSFERGALERVILDEAQAQATASQRCAIWGYEGASAFGGVVNECSLRNGYGGCLRYFVTREYQCVGNPSDGNRYVPADGGTQARKL